MLNCQYGIKCYRENLQHIINYNHDEINKKRFDKIIKFYKTPNHSIEEEMSSNNSIFKYKNGQHFGMILWVLKNLKTFNSGEKKIIRQYFTTLEEDAYVDPIINNSDRKDKIIFKKKYMSVFTLWESELSNTKIIFSIKL
jgi:hypothetical protein